MQFDRFSVAILILRPDAPVLDDEAASALQDAHLSPPGRPSHAER
jgi:hypothetical protein